MALLFTNGIYLAIDTTTACYPVEAMMSGDLKGVLSKMRIRSRGAARVQTGWAAAVGIVWRNVVGVRRRGRQWPFQPPPDKGTRTKGIGSQKGGDV